MIFSSYQVGVAAEAAAASLFSRCGAEVLVQYGANQPEFDLVVSKHKERSDRTLIVSVKGSKDGSWGLTQSLKNKEVTYLAAIERWLERHNTRTIFCLVQFKGVPWNEMPRMYLATPLEIADRLRATANGRGEYPILYESHQWSPRAVGAGTTELIPTKWQFTQERLEALLESGTVSSNSQFLSNRSNAMPIEIIVETFRQQGEPSSRPVRVRPIPGQFDQDYRVSCPASERMSKPQNKLFRILVDWVRPKNRKPSLRISGDAWNGVTDVRAKRFIARKLRPAR